jgi:hypothetical protein
MRRFIETLRPHPHERYDALCYHQILDEPLDVVLRFEHLEEDFAALLERSGLPPVLLPHVERRDRRPYRDDYDTGTRQLVDELFARDIAHYGHAF